MAPLIQTARTRSALRATHLLHTPDAFVRTPLPGLRLGTAIVHAAPALGAQFCWIAVELEAGGVLLPGAHARVLYVLAGEAQWQGQTMAAGSYAYLAAEPDERQAERLAEHHAQLEAVSATRLVMLKKRYERLPGIAAPGPFTGEESAVAPAPLAGDSNLMVRALLPAEMRFDFALNTMEYAPGAALPQVEIHYMEHGLLMLEGDGLYLLGDTWYPVAAGDFIWMAPFCPQQFMAGAAGAKYLIYKNFNRAPEL